MRSSTRYGRKFIGFYAPRALWSDLWRLARTEDRSLSAVVSGLLRLGIGRYFELADAKMAAPLLAKMRDVFGSEDDPFDPKTGANATRARMAERATNAAEFDAAIDEGLRAFSDRYGEDLRVSGPVRRAVV